jgi:nucleoside-diphosphate-sugar epimerase
VFGDPNAYLSLVHADDAAGAVIAALNAPPGTYNVAEAAPVTRGQLLAVMTGTAGYARLNVCRPGYCAWPAGNSQDC